MKRSKFSLSHHKLLSCDMGELVPIGLTEVLPGDSIQQATSLLLRVSPLLAPVMHPVHARIHHWFVPHRLVWDDFENFITGGPDGDDASVFPTKTCGTGQNVVPTVGTLADYLGVPRITSDTQSISALPFRGYAMIWNEFYRDADLHTALTISTASGADSTTSVALQNCSWEKDYFTSSRPWAQKGTEVTIGIGGTVDVDRAGDTTKPKVRKAGGGSSPEQIYVDAGGNLTVSGFTSGYLEWGTGTNDPGLDVDLSAASAISIGDLRNALALQRFMEARARYGSRYTEYLRYLGVRSSDARLQRPEYLGGGRQTIQFSEVLQTAVTTDGDDSEGVGNLKGHGIGAMRSNRYRRFFEEHGYIFSLLSVRPKTMYTQGLARTWNRRTKEDFFQKELQSIGQQEVLNKEIYAMQSGYDDVFGYQDRYDEYRRSESGVAGEFRDTTLDFWHMGRIFASAPSLNSTFVTSSPTKRINAVQTNDVLWIMAHHSIQARRLLKRSGTPRLF